MAKRLQPILPEAIKVLERCQEIEISKETKELLLKISSASIDRCLRPVRIKSLHGLSTTKSGSLLCLERVYDDLRLYSNCFQPSFKLIAKACTEPVEVNALGNRTLTRYDTAKTPYQRILERDDIPVEAKAKLMNLYVQLNPAELRRRIDQTITKHWRFPGNILA